MRAASARAFVFLLVGLMGLAAAAEGKDDAKAKFLEGVGLFEKEDYPGALASFEESYRIAPKPTVLYNVGMCQKALYRYADSMATFRRYLAEGGDKIKADRRREVEAAMAEMAGLMGRLRLEGAPDGAEVRVDGVPVGTTPLAEPLAIDPGRHALDVTKQGLEPLRIEITVASGGETPVRAALTPFRAALRVDCADKTALVSVDGKVVGGCPYQGVAEPGTRVVRVEAVGKKVFERKVDAKPGATAVVAVAFEPLAPAAAQKPVARKTPPVPPRGGEGSKKGAEETEGAGALSGLFIGGIVSTAVGIAGLGVGGYFTYKGFQDFKDGSDAADAGDDAAYAKVRDDRLPADRNGMIAGYVVGGALLATGVVLFVMDGQVSEEKDAAPVAVGPGGVTIVW
jgi:hypothetical protein